MFDYKDVTTLLLVEPSQRDAEEIQEELSNFGYGVTHKLNAYEAYQCLLVSRPLPNLVLVKLDRESSFSSLVFYHTVKDIYFLRNVCVILYGDPLPLDQFILYGNDCPFEILLRPFDSLALYCHIIKQTNLLKLNYQNSKKIHYQKNLETSLSYI